MEGEKEGGDGSGGALFFCCFQAEQEHPLQLTGQSTGWEKEGGLPPTLSISERRRGGKKQSTNSLSGRRCFLAPHEVALWIALKPVKQTSLACPRHRYTCHCLHSQRTRDSGESEGHFGSLQSWSGKACVAVSRAEIITRLCWLFNCYSVSRQKSWNTTRWAPLHQEDQKVPASSWMSWDFTTVQNDVSFVYWTLGGFCH